MRASTPCFAVFAVFGCALCVGAASCGGVDFADVVEGHRFGRSGSLLTQTASVTVDFLDQDVVTLEAVAEDGDTVTDRGTGRCARDGDPEEGAFETRLRTTDCVFEFVITTTEPPAEEDIPKALVVGFRNAEADGSVEIDPSLEGALPFPLSFADDYARLDLIE